MLTRIATLTGHGDAVFDACFSPDGRRLASCSRNGEVFVWSAECRIERRLKLSPCCNGVCFSPDGSLLAAGDINGHLVICHLETGRRVHCTPLPDIECLAVAPDGKSIVVGGRGPVVWVDPTTGATIGSLDPGAESIVGLAFSETGDVLAVSTWDRGVIFVDSASRRVTKIVQLPNVRDPVTTYCCIPTGDGETFGASLHIRRDGAIGESESPDLYEILLWRPFTEEADQRHTLLGHVSWIRRLAACPQRGLLASAGFDSAIKLWDRDFHTLLAESRDHAAPVYSVGFSPDGNRLVSASADRTLGIWELGDPQAQEDLFDSAPWGTVAEDLIRWEGEASHHALGRAAGHPLLATAQDIADRLLRLPASGGVMMSTVGQIVDYCYTLHRIDLGRAVEQTLNVRYEQARRTAQDQHAQRYYRLRQGFRIAITERMRATKFGLQRRRFDPVQPTIEIGLVTPGVGSPDNILALVESLINGGIDMAAATQRLAAMVVTASDVLWGNLVVHQEWPAIIAGRQAPGPAASAARILALAAQQVADPPIVIATQDQLGRLLSLGGEHADAVLAFEAATALARHQDDARLFCTCLGHLGNALRNVGRLREAREAYQEAITLARAPNLADLLAKDLLNLAILEADCGRRDEEGDLLLEARTIAEQYGLADDLTGILNHLGGYYFQLGDYAGAQDILHRALQSAERHQNDRIRAAILANLASVYANLHLSQEAREHAEQALEIARRINDYHACTVSLIALSEVAEAEGDIPAAIRWAGEATQLGERHDRPSLITTLLREARLRLRAGAPDAGIELLERATVAGEALRLQIVHSRDGDRIQNDLGAAYALLVETYVTAGDSAKAFVTTERARAALLRRRLLRENWPDALSLDSLVSVLKDIGPRTVLLSYFLTGEDLIIFGLRAADGSLRVQRVAGAEWTLRDAVKEFGREVKANHSLLGENWLRIGEILFDPVSNLLSDGDLLLLVPHGYLHNLPLHALAVRGTPIIDRCAIAYLPCASLLPSLVRANAAAPHAPTVIGAHFTAEAEAVARLLGTQPLSGGQISREQIVAAMRIADLTHVSAHGYFSSSAPEKSGFILRPSADVDDYVALLDRPGWRMHAADLGRRNRLEDASRDARITAEDLRSVALTADLVVMSACASGMIVTDPSDDPSGIVPTLLEQGARGVLASLWLVDASATLDLMTAFYTEFRRDGWKSPARALRVAMLAARSRDPGSYIWSPFMLVGGLVKGEAH